MVTALTSKLWGIVNSSSTYNFAENPLPVFFLLYAKKHGVTFSFDEEKKSVGLNGVDQLDEVASCMVGHLSENSMQDIQSDIEMFKTLWEEIQGNSSFSQFHYQVIDHLINDYAIATNTPILSNDIQSLVHNAVVAFYNNYSISDKEDEEDKKNPHWIDWYNFIDCQEYDKSKIFSFYLMNLVKKDANNTTIELKDLEDVQKGDRYIGIGGYENVLFCNITGSYAYYKKIHDLYSKEVSFGVALCFNKDFCKTAEFHTICKDLIDEDRVNFVIDIPGLDGKQSGFILIGVSDSTDGDVLCVNGGRALKLDGSTDFGLVIRNILINNNFSEWEGEKLDKYFRPDIIYKYDYDSIMDSNYELVPSTFWLWDNDISGDKVFIELSEVFEVVQPVKEPCQNAHYLTTFNFSSIPSDIFRGYKNYPQSFYQGMVRYQDEAVVLTAEDSKIKICRWKDNDEFATESKNLVLRLKKDSLVTLDYAAYALLSNDNIKEVGYNMCILDYEDNWHNFLKCKIAIHKDKAKQEEIVEHLRNEYAQQRQKELEAEMQRLGIRTASSDMVHMLGPTFAKIESTLYDLKSEELTATAQRAVEALNDNISYIKRFIKMAGADIMLVRMSMKERKVNEVISSIQKSWANLSASRIFEVTYQSGVSDNVTFKIDESYFRVLFDTLFDNAYRHGFGKRSAVGNKVCITSQLVRKNRKEYVLLTVANNGEPFPEDFTPQKFISRGEFCGETGRTGLGGNHIYSILKRHNGFLNVTHDAEWNCIFEMLIPVAFQNDVESKNVGEYGNSSKCL